MNCNGDANINDDSVICLDTSQECITINNDVDDKEMSSVNQILYDKTLSPGAAPDGFIILDESIEQNDDDNNDTLETDLPMFKVTFKDKSIFRKYQREVKDFFQQLVVVDSIDDNSNGSEIVLKIWGKSKSDSRKNVCDKAENRDNILFTIDNTPGGQDSLNIPTYGTKFDKVLEKSRNENEIKNDNACPKICCFNCLGDHNLRDCNVPRNQLEINKNRKEFTVKTGPRNMRYHVEDQKFKPGVLSAELRKALGLADNELPRHIFKMRLIGYPPGWLEEAKLEHSGLNLYNSEGNRELDPAEEAGEIFIPENNVKYDIKKLHDFPGFNIPAPPDTHDAFWSTDQQLFHSKETMLKMLSSRRTDEGYKRKKLKVNIGQSSPNDVVEPIEMDVECSNDEGKVELLSVNGSFVQPLPINSVTLPPGCDGIDTPKSITVDCNDISSRAYSPSLSDLESKKKLLLAALDDSNLQSNPGTPIKPTPQQLNFDTPKSSSIITSQSTPLSSSSVENTPKRGSVKSIELGTPILQSSSLYTKLPCSEKFSKDICDVINFENLPGATGSYEKISGILNKVRDVINKDNEN
ncbi:hypothetical protein PV328_008025 [Microctonus aethiopoides]|uniref:PSP proline-rich domain-containing protein n=1 Tax=Microctonus aethiopoides TaxID=144406 RepID=A0AA39CA60_9HYME|nr:hypothetical protein PV328_008025 [Microctonus aethiopoides]